MLGCGPAPLSEFLLAILMVWALFGVARFANWLMGWVVNCLEHEPPPVIGEWRGEDYEQRIAVLNAKIMRKAKD